MSLRCNKCHQGDPYLGDSWCLCCSSVEALNGELKCGWGNQGTRALAQDVLTTAVRQVRALRRLGLAGAGSARATTPARARRATSAPRGVEAAGEVRAAPPREPEAEAAREPPSKEAVKTEEKEADTEPSEYTDDEEESQAEEEAPAAPGLKPAPKAAVEKDSRSEIPRRRVSEGLRSSREAGSYRAPEGREEVEHREERHRTRDERRSHRSEEGRHRHRHRSRSRRREADDRAPRTEGKRKRKKNRPGHRGGSKHQKTHKAQDDPYRRFHYKQPASFWDRPPSPHH
jgi:hypothetical protein